MTANQRSGRTWWIWGSAGAAMAVLAVVTVVALRPDGGVHWKFAWPNGPIAMPVFVPPNRIFVEAANIAGLQQWAAQRGLPSAQANTCLANQAEVDKLVQIQTDAVSNFNVPGTPAFVINGKLVESASAWETLEPKLREALR